MDSLLNKYLWPYTLLLPYHQTLNGTYVSKFFAKSINLVCLITKTFIFKVAYFLISFFKLYQCPILKYNVSVWRPYEIGDIRKIESVQATFTRLVCKKLNIKYDSYKLLQLRYFGSSIN